MMNIPLSVDDLTAKLKIKLRGEVRFDDGSRALYATDASNYRQIPIGVVFPKDTEEVVQTIAICREFGAAVLPRGSGTSLAGQCCNVAVILDFSRYLNKIIETNPQEKWARVEPGVILDQLQDELQPHGVMFGPDPATHNRCTFGGMIGNNACGVHSILAGKTVDNIEELEILTYDGLRMRVGATSDDQYKAILNEGGRRAEIYRRLEILRGKYASKIRDRYPKLPRRVSGYNLDALLPENGFNIAKALVGTEGTCVSVLEAKVKLIARPAFRSLLVLGYPDVYAAGDDVPRVLQFKPIGVEGLDEFFVRNMKKAGLHLPEIAMLPEGQSWLLVEFGGESQADADEQAQRLIENSRWEKTARANRLYSNPSDQKAIWSVRESSFGATVFVPGERDTFAGFEDSAVPPEKLGKYLRDLRKLYDRYDYYVVTYGHFGDGCLHTRVSFDLRTDEGIKKYRAFQSEAADLVVSYGGSLSGEHGDGQTWGDFLGKMYGEDLVEAFLEFKRIWDPDSKMNPKKVVNAYRSDENLRLKKYKTIPEPKLYFHYPQESGNFARATERCIGIGKCLKKDTGTMCPSYMVSGEEEHSTRGRAHLLHEMMRGESIKGGWTDEHVKHSLDLCLACKACKSECPVSVDMAKYKSEFLAHYYKSKPRPLTAYAFGLIGSWAQIGAAMPGLANIFTQTPLLSNLAKKIIGIAPERTLPKFAQRSFRRQFASNKCRGAVTAPDTAKGGETAPGTAAKGGEIPPQHASTQTTVLLWPDTFNNAFYPETAIAAAEVLQQAGFNVTIPKKNLCCGRPFYDFGMLDQARAYLLKILGAIEKEINSGMPVIVLEPSCLSVFRDELVSLFPNDERAKRLSSQCYSLAEFLNRSSSFVSRASNGDGRTTMPGHLILHGHCHQKAGGGMSNEEALLEKFGADYKLLDSGCCGMAGAFGFEKEHYDISMKIGERVLLPAARAAGKDEIIVTDGFSCREQVLQSTGKKPMHFAELLNKILKSESRISKSLPVRQAGETNPKS